MSDSTTKPLYIVSLSSGISSAIAADRILKRHNHDNVQLVFMDTLWEDEDNYRFLDDLEAYWNHPIIRITEGRTPLEVADDEHVIPNQKVAPCTKRLKIIPFVNHVKAMQAQGYAVTVCLGMNWTEPHRMAAPTRNYAQIGVNVEFPCMWKPIDFHPHDTVRSWGIEPPRMYSFGYSHANCGGRCIKQGIKAWERTLLYFPDRFSEVEDWEREKRKDPMFADYAILRDSSGGTVTARTLESVRLDVETRQPAQLSLWGLFEDDMSNCFCNAGDPGDLCETT